MFWRLFLSLNLCTSFVFVFEISLNICNHDLSVAIRIIIVSVIVLIVDFMTETWKSVSSACKIDLDICRNKALFGKSCDKSLLISLSRRLTFCVLEHCAFFHSSVLSACQYKISNIGLLATLFSNTFAVSFFVCTIGL